MALVSPASPLSADDLGVMTDLLHGAGYLTRVMPHALERMDHLAGDDRDRARDLTDAFLDPGIHAIMCTRGGYGCARLMEHLDLDEIARHPKLFLGFSDITTLHIALNRRGMPTVHAPMALTLTNPKPEWVYDSLRSVLKGEDPIHPDAPRATTLVGGIAEGEVVGGCMCLLTDSLATPDPLETAGRILIVEDVDEAPHRVDAMLTHLRNAGLLKACAGIAFGEMTRTDERTDGGIGGRPWREIVRERTADLGVPVVTDLPFGHNRAMLSLPLGVRARLDADAGTLTYTEGWCA